MVLPEAEIKDERELEILLKNDPEQIEKGLSVIGNQIKTPPSENRIDLLCVDSQNLLTIVEIKLDSDDHQMEQAIIYFDWALANLDWIKNSYRRYRIENEKPRIILIAKKFSHSVITLAKYFNDITRVNLYTYIPLKVGDKKQIVCNEYPLPSTPELLERPKTIPQLISYITNSKVRNECEKSLERLKELDLEPRPIKYEIVFKYRGRNVCSIVPRREYFLIYYLSQSGEWRPSEKIINLEDLENVIKDNIKPAMEIVKNKINR